MIITLSGSPGSGKSSVAKLLAKKLSYKYLSAGDIQRIMGKERGMSIHKWDRYVELHPEVDRMVEDRMLAEGKKCNTVMDWRMGFHFAKNAPKIFLYVKPAVGAKRIYKEHRSSEAENTTLLLTKKNMVARHRKLVRRLLQLYKVDYSNKKNYDLVIDTSNMTIDETVEKIVHFLKTKGRLA